MPASFRASSLVALLVLSPAFAGCFSDDGASDPGADVAPAGSGEPGAPTDGNGTEPTTPPPTGKPPTTTPVPPDATPLPSPAVPPQAVVAVIDSGINPYHLVFRDSSTLSTAHPATYLSGYPSDARPLFLSLDAASYEEALKQDADVWAQVETGVLYYVPGTRIVGMYTTAVDGDVPGLDENGHGTMTASRAVGAGTSLAGGARIVAVEGLTAESVTWAASQPWIDISSNSWSTCIGVGIPATCTKSPITQETTDAFEAAAAKQLVLAATGNGLGGWAGVLGMPATSAPNAGARGVIGVGGHDNGDVTPWTGTIPHVVADACNNPAADHESMDRVGAGIGSGTSSATPFVAGAALRILLDARAILATGVRPSSGPLADGDFSLDEWRQLLLATASPRPTEGAHDGSTCDLFMAPYSAAPVAWTAIPEDVPAEYFVGYGGIDAATVAAATSILRGETDVPDRASTDAFFETEAVLRATY